MALPDVEKAAFRTQARNRRVAIAKDKRRVASRLACDHLMNSPLWHSVSSLALYAAYGSEIDPGYLESNAIKAGKRIYYPRVIEDKLEFVESRLENLVEGFATILEPKGPPVAIESIELIIVPGLAFGPQGQRLGSGRGFYDRTLHEDTLTVGIAFHEQISDRVPTLPHDVRMKGVLTNEGFTLEPSTQTVNELQIAERE